MEEALTRVAEVVADSQRRLGLDWRSSYSKIAACGSEAIDVELSREEVFRAVAEGLGGAEARGEAGAGEVSLSLSGVSVRLRLLGAERGRLLWTTSSVADVRRQSAHSAELVSQLIMGETARALRTEGDWHLVRLADDYHGWIRSWCVRDVDESAVGAYAAAAYAVVVASVGYVYSEPDEQSVPVADVVAGVVLAAGRAERGFRRVALPGGRSGFLRESDIASPPCGPPDRSRIVERAGRFLGIPYLWGGTTAKGFDCSGLVKRVFAMEGVALPRDSDRQALVGSLIPREDVRRARPGDLLFFGEGGTVSHVAIHAGGGAFIHSHGEVRITSLAPGDERYEEKFARIVLFGRSVIP